MTKTTSDNERGARMRARFEAAGADAPRSLETLIAIDPGFAEGCLQFAARPWRAGALPEKVKQLIRLAVAASVTQLHAEATRSSISRALAAGASAAEIVEVLELTSVLGIHTMTLAAPILIEELDKAGAPMAAELSARQAEVKAEYIRQRGVWPPPWEAFLRLDPEYVQAYRDFSMAPFRDGGALELKVKELIWIAVDTTTTHLHEYGSRGHIAGAISAGATQEEISEVLQLVSGVGMYTLDLALPILAEELARQERDDGH
jgi:alkylhydroperoxidase/carboxymuconolactone decarboxylase family protein YurZ